MKRIMKAFLIIHILTVARLTTAEEPQLSEYQYTRIQPMLDGYIYVETEQTNNIVKPNGEFLFDNELYSVEYDDFIPTNSQIITEYAFCYPQNEEGNRFVVKKSSNNKETSQNIYFVMNENGQIISNCYSALHPKGRYYYIFAKQLDEKSSLFKNIEYGVVNAFSGTELVSNVCQAYMSLDYNKIAVICKSGYNGEIQDDDLVSIIYYDKGKLYSEEKQLKWSKVKSELMNGNNIVIDRYGTKLYGMTSLMGEYISAIEHGKQELYWDFDFLNIKTEYDNKNNKLNILDFQSKRVDKSYDIREKQIDGKTRYALFTELQNNETETDISAAQKNIGINSIIYTIIGTFFVLFVGAFLNDKLKCKTVK